MEDGALHEAIVAQKEEEWRFLKQKDF